MVLLAAPWLGGTDGRNVRPQLPSLLEIAVSVKKQSLSVGKVNLGDEADFIQWHAETCRGLRLFHN